MKELHLSIVNNIGKINGLHKNFNTTTFNQTRLNPYLKKCGNDKRKALNLYLWNMQIAEHFLTQIGIFEILFRNSLDINLRNQYSSAWLTNLPTNMNYLNGELNKITSRLSKTKYSFSNDDIVAGLTLGSWVTIFEREFRIIFQNNPRDVFPNMTNNKNFNSVLRDIRQVQMIRNRVTHHEKLFHLDLTLEQSRLIELIYYLDKEFGNYAKSISKLNLLLTCRP